MARVSLDEIKLEDVDFDKVKECTDKHVLKRYIKLIEDDGNFFVDLLNACKNKLLEVAPKDYYLLYPRFASDSEVNDATQDLLEWENAVKETDKALMKSKQERIFDDVVGYKVTAPIRGQEPVVARANIQKEPGARHLDQVKDHDDVYARDKSNMKDYYRAWDKVDVDALEEEMDKEEREAEEARRRHFEELKGEQNDAQATTPIRIAGVADGVPEAHRKHMADSEKEKGNEAFYARDFEEAEAYYTRSISFKADDPSTWANRALVRLKNENPQGALQDCDHALAVNPNYMKALHRKGKALHELQRYEEAVKYFQLALAESPGNTQINGDLMVARRKLRAVPTPPAQKPPPPQRSALQTSTCRIEELDPETELPLGQERSGPQAPPPAANYTRVMIEEDSDSESEDGGSAVAGVAQGFRKVQIEEVSGSEDEDEAAPATSSAAKKEESLGARKDEVVQDSNASVGLCGARSDISAFEPPPRAQSAALPGSSDAAPATAPASDSVSFDDMD